MNKKIAESMIGTWGFIIGNRRITKEFCDKSFPQGFFGKIISYDKRKGFTIRCYRKKNRNSKRHTHLHCEPKYFSAI